jgi:hypothetical protein
MEDRDTGRDLEKKERVVREQGGDGGEEEGKGRLGVGGKR